MAKFDLKFIWQIIGLIAAGLIGEVLRRLGLGPRFSAGWLLLTGLVLIGWGGHLFEKAHREWDKSRWSYQAVEHVVYAGLLSFFGIACILGMLFAPAAH